MGKCIPKVEPGVALSMPCPLPVNVQGQAGQGLQQSGLVEVSLPMAGVERSWSLKSFPAQPILSFNETWRKPHFLCLRCSWDGWSQKLRKGKFRCVCDTVWRSLDTDSQQSRGCHGLEGCCPAPPGLSLSPVTFDEPLRVWTAAEQSGARGRC